MTNQEIFLGILKCFICQDNQLPDTGKMEQADWEMILRLASEHAVLPIVYSVIWKQESFQKLPEQMQNACKQQIKRQVIVQTQLTSLFLEFYKLLIASDVTPLVMKGIICRSMYTQPDYRISGDEDLLIKKEEFHRLDVLLKDNQFQREEYENPLEMHEITYIHPRNGLRLEVHLSLFPEESGSYGRLNREFPQIFQRSIVQIIQNTEIHTMDPTQHMLYLLCHGLKHFLHSGFGIRQLCDMILFAEHYGDKIDWNEVIRRTKAQNMYVFWMNLFDIGEKYLGFSWKKAGLSRPDEEILHSEEMLGDILDSGIYGKSSDERVHSANITLQASNQSQQKQLGLGASLFPGIDYMSRYYPYLEEKKWLLPFAWGQRLAAYGRKTDRKEMSRTVTTGKKRVELLKQYGIIEK